MKSLLFDYPAHQKHITPYIDTLTETELSRRQEICTKTTALSLNVTLYFGVYLSVYAVGLKQTNQSKTFCYNHLVNFTNIL